MIAFIWALISVAVWTSIFLDNRARRRRLIAEIEKEERKTEVWFECIKSRLRLFQNNMLLLEERRAKTVTPEPEPPGRRKPAGKKEFTVQNVVNLIEASGLHVERIDEIYPAIDPFVFHKPPEKEREVTAIGLTVSPKGRFIRVKKIRRRSYGF